MIFVLSSPAGERLAPTEVKVGSQRLTVSGDAPKAPDVRTAARLSVNGGSYPLQVGDVSIPAGINLGSNQVEPVLLAVSDGRVNAGGVYVGNKDVNIGLSELGGQLTRLGAFHLVDQQGRSLTADSLLGRDTVIAAFHTTCRETCPLYTGLLMQLRKTAPQARLLEVTTDPTTDTPQVLADYASKVGADWTFATGTADEVTEFWAPFGVSLAAGDSHTSALALVDSHGFLRATYTGVPDVGGSLPGVLQSQLDAAGRQLLAGHGEGWGAPAVLESLRTLTRADAPSSAGGQVPAFNLPDLNGARIPLEEFRGTPVIVNFWYAGCPPCQQEMPLLQEVAVQHPEVALLLVNYRDSAQTARQFLSSRHITSGTVLLDQDGQVAAGYRVAGFPTTVFVRPDGSELSRHPGPLTADVLAANLSDLGAR